jgi:acetyl-CoA synthetase
MWGKLYGQWFMGAGLFVYDFDKFIPHDLLEKLQQYRITTFCAPPTIYRFLIKEGLENYDLSSIQYATTAGEALNPEVFRQFEAKTGLRIHEAFGQTETTVLLGNFIHAGTEKIGSLGKACPLYDVAVVDEEGSEVPDGTVGELVIKAIPGHRPVGMFQKYFESDDPDAAKTEDVWHDGLYHTGDTVWRDEDGFFWYVGRIDDVIKSSGYRIGPFEIESVIMELPQVLECGVTGVPDPIRGTVVKATIVLAKGYEPSDALAKEIQNYVKEQTAPYKYPRIVEFVDELPKTISGKIRRVELRK